MAYFLTNAEVDTETVLIKRPMRECEVMKIKPTLHKMRDIVNGFIKLFEIPTIPNVYGYYNPPAQYKGGHPNFFIYEQGKELIGTAVFFRLDKDGYVKSLKSEDIVKITDYMSRNMYKSKEHFKEHMADLYGMEL